MNARHLAQALYDLMHGQSASVQKATIEKFLKLIRAKNLERLLPRILSEVERIEAVEKRKRTCEILVCDDHDIPLAKTEALKLIKETGDDPESWSFVEKKERELVGGYVVRTPSKLRDASYRTALLNLYQQLRGEHYQQHT